ncbi:uncharacterized protein B0H18DRAFT_874518 [Fomitopsis serialis]|uniref:uncharacterized protein n=1 Tax=Fomitopsis serialis TaxID=139415 RepID=UPI002007CE61|nr:uncharacterized protein B0H18DRAFT_874518 [Neoantrodia serialis]KAH9928833.1 hypothetical protein B0H18DRAFT_874518 [Neoantrodia serialis]
MLSTLTLAGDAIPKPIILSRRLDFPSRQCDYDLDEYITRPDWQPSPLPKDGHLSLHLGECIAGGRSAVVYAAEISTAYEAGTIPLSNPHPLEQEFCVKIARRNRCRTLAREAWVCEQLRSRGQLQGVIAPRFYGFFTASLPDDQSAFPLWDADDFKLEIPDDDPTCDDPLPDDEPLEEEYDNGPGGRECSPWCDWRPDPNSPLLAVIVMSRGGATYTREDDADKANQKDIRAILDDLSRIYLWHGDLRPNNLVRAPAGTMLCKKHKRVHKWNIIDFAWTGVDDADSDVGGKSKLIRESQRASYRGYYFWHGSLS